MTLKITLRGPITLKNHWNPTEKPLKPHWKPLKPHWKTTETPMKNHWNHTEKPLKSFTKDKHTEIISLITLKFVCYCYPRMSNPYNPTEKCQCYSYPLLSQFSVLLSFSVRFSVSHSRSEDSCAGSSMLAPGNYSHMIPAWLLQGKSALTPA